MKAVRNFYHHLFMVMIKTRKEKTVFLNSMVKDICLFTDFRSNFIGRFYERKPYPDRISLDRRNFNRQ